jgi:hypothetical protein
MQKTLPSLDWLIEHSRRNRILIDGSLLRNLGYFSVDISKSSWTSAQHWCEQNVGKDDYTWTGYTFWFRNKNHAFLFSLAYST